MLLVLPIVIPFFTAVIALMARGRIYVQRSISGAGAVAHLVCGGILLDSVSTKGILVLYTGSWPAPFGISLVADLFSAILVVITGAIGVVVTMYSIATIDRETESAGYHPLMHTLLMGVSGAFLTGDLFNLYVWFEVLLTSSFVLMAIGGAPGQWEGTFKYLLLSLISSALFLLAAGLLYASTGTLNMADAAVRLREPAAADLTTVIALLFMVAFGIKAAVFPLFFWLPASYHTPPLAVTTLFSALMTKVGVYALIRVFTLIFTRDATVFHPLLMIVAGLTMLTGVLGAIAQMDIRRLLSFHIISQIGYLVMGLGIFTPLALGGTVFFMTHVIFAKSALFLLGGVIRNAGGSDDLRKLGGLYADTPALALVFFLVALSLAGLPPFSGFWAKLLLLRAGLESGEYTIVATGLAVSILTLYSMMKIWNEAFWKDPAQGDKEGVKKTSAAEWVPVLAVSMIVLVLGFAAGPFLELALRAGEQLMNPTEYISTVLQGVR